MVQNSLLLLRQKMTLVMPQLCFWKLTHNKAAVFSDVRTFWSPESVKRLTGHQLSGKAANGVLHLLNSGASALDGSGGSLTMTDAYHERVLEYDRSRH